MNLKSLADEVGISVPVAMSIRQKYGLTSCTEYQEGHVILMRKLLYLSLCSVSVKDINALLDAERSLLELLKVDSLHGTPDWFESICTIQHGPTRLLLTGHDINHPVLGNAVQAGLDFAEREKELFGDREMGADVLAGLRRYAKILGTIRDRLNQELPIHREALRWCRQVTKVAV